MENNEQEQEILENKDYDNFNEFNENNDENDNNINIISPLTCRWSICCYQQMISRQKQMMDN